MSRLLTPSDLRRLAADEPRACAITIIATLA